MYRNDKYSRSSDNSPSSAFLDPHHTWHTGKHKIRSFQDPRGLFFQIGVSPSPWYPGIHVFSLARILFFFDEKSLGGRTERREN